MLISWEKDVREHEGMQRDIVENVHTPSTLFLFLLVEKHQIVCYNVTDVQVNDPVHEVEADEAHGENDT